MKVSCTTAELPKGLRVSGEAGLELLVTVDLLKLLVCGQSVHWLSEALHSLSQGTDEALRRPKKL